MKPKIIAKGIITIQFEIFYTENGPWELFS